MQNKDKIKFNLNGYIRFELQLSNIKVNQFKLIILNSKINKFYANNKMIFFYVLLIMYPSGDSLNVSLPLDAINVL